MEHLAPLQERLVEAIKRRRFVDDQDLGRAQAAAEYAGHRVEATLVELGLLSESQLFDILVNDLGIGEFVRTGDVRPVLVEGLPSSYLADVSVLPLQSMDGNLLLGMVNPFDDFAADCIALKTGLRVTRARLSQGTFERLWSAVYGDQPEVRDAVLSAETSAASNIDLALLRDSASEAPVIRFVQGAIRRAVDLGASDIHLRPLGQRAEMLFRIDGELVAQPPPDGAIFGAIISRLKIMASLDIAERRLPQDGKIRTNIAGRAIDIRISTLAQSDGEGAVLRLLSRELTRVSLAELGFSPAIASGISKAIGFTDGLLLVTGPTGSGKSTTLHAMMRQIWRPGLNIVSIEDPIEYRSEGVSQVEIDEKIGLTFPKVLRSVLRHDPDVIMIGEIRDAETAAIGVQAALTGHLVLATLHTNSALAAVPRLVDMGVEPYLLASVLRGVLAQRLVRRRCSDCDAGRAADGNACVSCGGSGAKGRLAVGEFALLDSQLIEALSRGTSLPEKLSVRLSQSGYTSLADDIELRRSAGELFDERGADVSP